MLRVNDLFDSRSLPLRPPGKYGLTSLYVAAGKRLPATGDLCADVHRSRPGRATNAAVVRFTTANS